MLYSWSPLNTLIYLDWERSVIRESESAVLQISKLSSPVLFLKYRIPNDGLSDGIRTASLGESSFQSPIPIMIRVIMIDAGRISFCRPNVTVISLDVRGLLSGIFLSVVGMPFSIFWSSECSSSAL